MRGSGEATRDLAGASRELRVPLKPHSPSVGKLSAHKYHVSNMLWLQR